MEEGSSVYMYHRWWGTFWPTGWIVFGVGVVLLIVFLVLLAVFLFRWAEGKPSRSKREALEILKERLARGEITEEEYERLKRKIEE